MTIVMDQLDNLSASVFDGYLVRKDLVRKYSRQYPVPTYVVEFLLGRYCATTNEQEIAEGLLIVEKQLKDRTVRTGEEELFKSHAKEGGSVKLIDIVRARLDPRNDCYLAELPSLALRDVRIDDQLVRENERMLTDGFYAEVTLSYDGIVAQQQSGRPFKIDALRPIQMSKSDVLEVLSKARRAFTTQQWIDLILRSVGLEPSALKRQSEASRAASYGAVHRTELQHGGDWASRHRQEPSFPTNLSLCSFDLGRQSDGRKNVR